LQSETYVVPSEGGSERNVKVVLAHPRLHAVECPSWPEGGLTGGPEREVSHSR
jgi:hypothetical protein